MIIKTQSGNVMINKRSKYGKWLRGWLSGNGWTGANTLREAYQTAKYLHDKLPMGACSWYALGYLMTQDKSTKEF